MLVSEISVKEVISMTWKIKSLIIVLVLLCVPAAALVLDNEATTHSGAFL